MRDIVNTSGTVLDHVVYDSFGDVTSETNPSNGDRFKFAGMEYDSATGQYYDRARYYDPATGRFDEQDPSGYSAGDMDLYRYVGNGPTDGVDQTGTNASMDYMDQYEAILEQTVGLCRRGPRRCLPRRCRNPPRTPDSKRSLALKGTLYMLVRNCQTSRQRSIWSRPGSSF